MRTPAWEGGRKECPQARHRNCGLTKSTRQRASPTLLSRRPGKGPSKGILKLAHIGLRHISQLTDRPNSGRSTGAKDTGRTFPSKPDPCALLGQVPENWAPPPTPRLKKGSLTPKGLTWQSVDFTGFAEKWANDKRRLMGEICPKIPNGYGPRRGRDSNPRWGISPYSLSRGAPSAARPPLRGVLPV